MFVRIRSRSHTLAGRDMLYVRCQIKLREVCVAVLVSADDGVNNEIHHTARVAVSAHYMCIVVFPVETFFISQRHSHLMPW